METPEAVVRTTRILARVLELHVRGSPADGRYVMEAKKKVNVGHAPAFPQVVCGLGV